MSRPHSLSLVGTPAPKRSLWALGLGLVLATALPGCIAHAQGELVADYPADYVEEASVPVQIEAYPRVYYRGEPAYLADGRWYYRSHQRWVVFRNEPLELRDYRVRHPGYVARPARYAPDRRQERWAAERRVEEKRAERNRYEERREAERRAEQRRDEQRREADHRADERRREEQHREAERNAQRQRLEQQRQEQQRAQEERQVAERRGQPKRRRDRAHGDQQDSRDERDRRHYRQD